MASSGILLRVALVRAGVSEERMASIIRVTRIGELETTVAVTSYRRTLQRNTIPQILQVENSIWKFKNQLIICLLYTLQNSKHADFSNENE
jgi:hypothetical protein